MRIIQLAAAVFLIVGTVAAGFTIRQIIAGTTTVEPRLQGPAPVLIGDAPPPATETPSAPPAPPASATPTPLLGLLPPSTGNLGPPARTRAEVRATEAAPEHVEQHRSAPVALRIPQAGIQATIIPVGLNARGEMASPDDFSQVGWWQHGAAPGEPGRAVLAGHVDTPDGKAIFYGIDALQPGDEIFVSLAGLEGDARELRFIVTGTALYHVDHAPVDQIFGTSGERELILITCGGAFDRSAGVYLYRQVVFAALVT